MPLLRPRFSRATSAYRCGPIFMISMLAAVIGLFLLISVFSHRRNETPPRTGQPTAVTRLPKQ